MIVLIEQFRVLSKTLEQYKATQFPVGSMVKYKNQFCIVSREDGCPPDHLPLRFENGNVWWKPLDECRRAKIQELPHYARRMKLQSAGFKCCTL